MKFVLQSHILDSYDEFVYRGLDITYSTLENGDSIRSSVKFTFVKLPNKNGYVDGFPVFDLDYYGSDYVYNPINYGFTFGDGFVLSKNKLKIIDFNMIEPTLKEYLGVSYSKYIRNWHYTEYGNGLLSNRPIGWSFNFNNTMAWEYYLSESSYVFDVNALFEYGSQNEIFSYFGFLKDKSLFNEIVVYKSLAEKYNIKLSSSVYYDYIYYDNGNETYYTNFDITSFYLPFTYIFKKVNFFTSQSSLENYTVFGIPITKDFNSYGLIQKIVSFDDPYYPIKRNYDENLGTLPNDALINNYFQGLRHFSNDGEIGLIYFLNESVSYSRVVVNEQINVHEHSWEYFQLHPEEKIYADVEYQEISFNKVSFFYFPIKTKFFVGSNDFDSFFPAPLHSLPSCCLIDCFKKD